VNPGRLIVFEGLDGCGKTTQVEALCAALRGAGRDVVQTGEPTDGPNGRRIRELARSGQGVSAVEELRCFLEDRRAHVAEVIGPALAAGRIVVCDRYTLSTVAYQGARGLDWRQLLTEAEAEFPLPDLVLLLEIDPVVGLARVERRGSPREGLFEEGARMARVAEIFRGIERPYVERIDAAPPPEEVERAVRACVRRRLDLP
jgi:dTMP kinase